MEGVSLERHDGCKGHAEVGGRSAPCAIHLSRPVCKRVQIYSKRTYSHHSLYKSCYTKQLPCQSFSSVSPSCLTPPPTRLLLTMEADRADCASEGGRWEGGGPVVYKSSSFAPGHCCSVCSALNWDNHVPSSGVYQQSNMKQFFEHQFSFLLRSLSCLSAPA